MTNDEEWEQQCACPPPLSDNLLIAAVDGEADEETLAHLRACPVCTARVMHLRALQAYLLRRLYRLHCPPTSTLVDYCQGLLDPRALAAVSHHLAICPHCTAEVKLLQEGPILARAVGRRGRTLTPNP
ncbi:MAG: hypothetical protein N2378_00635 [Chloroflexaceae bacterium]|nr:hypothetical protein [Chloroflexaceae bacterium]